MNQKMERLMFALHLWAVAQHFKYVRHTTLDARICFSVSMDPVLTAWCIAMHKWGQPELSSSVSSKNLAGISKS